MNDLVRNWLRCFRLAPLGVLGLFVFLGLPSTMLFTEEYEYLQSTTPWHAAFFTKFDLLLIPGVLISCLTVRLIPESRTAILFLFAAVAIVLSILCSPAAHAGALSDGLLHWLRFVSVFSFAYGLTRRLGWRAAESLLYLYFFLLCLSAMFVYHLEFQTFQRIYAAGMSVGSFAQVTAVVSLITLARRHIGMLCIGLLFLVLTFSLTSTILFIWIAAFVPLWSSDSNAQVPARWFLLARFRQLLLAGTAFAACNFLLGAILSGVGYDLDVATIGSLHGRSDIWLYALMLIQQGYVGVFGCGFGTSAEFFQNNALLASYASWDVQATHFHSILLEAVVGLGILCLPPLAALVCRIEKTWRQSRYLPCAIFLFFLLSQCIDFIVYRPKEIVIWAFMLGLAEGLASSGDSVGTAGAG
jgi:hypothetical protein